MAKKSKKSKSTIIGVVVVVIVLAVMLAGAYYTGFLKFTGMATSASSIAAKVNSEQITNDELDKQYELFFLLVSYPEEYKEQITKQVYLNQMILEEIIIQEAEKIGISQLLVTDKEFKETLDMYIQSNQITSSQLVESLVAKGLTVEELQKYFKKQIAINDFLNQTLLGNMQVTKTEAKQFYDTNIDQFTAQEGQIRARHILVQTEKEANDIIQQIREGKDFAELARQKSIDTASGARGGDLGFFTKDMMVKEFADAAFDLTVNKISKPVQTQFGWHVIQRQSDKILFDEIKEALEAQINQEKQKAALQIYIEQLKSAADIQNYLENSTKE